MIDQRSTCFCTIYYKSCTSTSVVDLRGCLSRPSAHGDRIPNAEGPRFAWRIMDRSALYVAFTVIRVMDTISCLTLSYVCVHMAAARSVLFSHGLYFRSRDDFRIQATVPCVGGSLVYRTVTTSFFSVYWQETQQQHCTTRVWSW